MKLKISFWKQLKRTSEPTNFHSRPELPSTKADKAPPKYSPERFRHAVIEAEKNECEYFDFSTPENELLDSMNDFAKNVMPSFT